MRTWWTWKGPVAFIFLFCPHKMEVTGSSGTLLPTFQTERYCHIENSSAFILINMGFHMFKHRHGKLALDFGNFNF
jgi:hypothetical protein